MKEFFRKLQKRGLWPPLLIPAEEVISELKLSEAERRFVTKDELTEMEIWGLMDRIGRYDGKVRLFLRHSLRASPFFFASLILGFGIYMGVQFSIYGVLHYLGRA